MAAITAALGAFVAAQRAAGSGQSCGPDAADRARTWRFADRWWWAAKEV